MLDSVRVHEYVRVSVGHRIDMKTILHVESCIHVLRSMMAIC